MSYIREANARDKKENHIVDGVWGERVDREDISTYARCKVAISWGGRVRKRWETSAMGTEEKRR